MVANDIENLITTSKSGTVTTYDHTDSYSVDNADTEGLNYGKTYYTMDWSKWYGYYKGIPEFQQVIDTLMNWSVGKGFKAKLLTKKTLSRIKGNGKESFNMILSNMGRTALTGGDSYAEIVRDRAKRITNIKPLKPSYISIVYDEFGIIDGYEQFVNRNGKREVIQTFKPSEILHFSWNRMADELHGIPFAQKLERIILMIWEAMEDQKIVFHRYVKPLQIFEAETDDPTELETVETKINSAYGKTENMVIPKDTMKLAQLVSVPQYSTLDPLNWLKFLIRQFVTSCGVPEVVMGWGEETTESASKVIYGAFEQTIQKIQLWIEETIKIQLNIEINLEFPNSMFEDLKKDQKKDGPQKGNQPSDTKLNMQGTK